MVVAVGAPHGLLPTVGQSSGRMQCERRIKLWLRNARRNFPRPETADSVFWHSSISQAGYLYTNRKRRR